MSIKLASSEISRFLASSEAEVLCIRGRWGVGKTFAWTHYLDAAAKKKTVALNRYSYVSLFGQNSLADVRSAVVENTVQVGDRAGTTASSLAKMAEQGTRGLAKIAKYLPRAKDYAPLGDRLMFAMLKGQIVCIDDLERAGTGLSKVDVLGLISELKEQKRCKVVLLLNYEELGEDQAIFDAQIEKVADTVISFDPTPAEAAEIGVDKSTKFATELTSHCTLLRITNIRVIKRIERLAHRLGVVFAGRDSRVLKQSIHSMALFAYAKYQPNTAPSLEFIRGFNGIADLVGREGPIDRPEWRALLGEYGFGSVDEFDVSILEGVERGYFDDAVLQEKAARKEIQLQLEDKDSSFSQAWRRYHDSFNDDGDAVLDGMFTAFKNSIAAITPLNVDGTARLFKDLGRPEQSRELVEFYVDNRDEGREFWNVEEYTFGGDFRDPDVLELFAQKYAAIEPEQYDAGELLVRISRNRGWNESYIAYLASLSADDFYAVFKSLRGDDLRRATREALRFRNRGAVGSPEQTIGIRADEALNRIAEESDINARRVQQRRSEV